MQSFSHMKIDKCNSSSINDNSKLAFLLLEFVHALSFAIESDFRRQVEITSYLKYLRK